MSRYLTIISRLRDQGFRLDKAQELRAASIPYDETEDALNQLFFRLVQAWTLGVDPEPPALSDRRPDEYTLPELEQQCRKLDLYYSCARSFGFEIDADALSAAIAMAKQVQSSSSATQAEVDAAAKSLNAAVKALVKKTGNNGSSSNSSSSSNSGNNGSSNSGTNVRPSNNGSSVTPNTGPRRDRCFSPMRRNRFPLRLSGCSSKSSR